ncbi:MAG: geranylgeranylglyceryl/heptaprenylglyceryl phosphate synthase [Hymenobacteraceae bacterium]|nr:geranylgeranylglyceryl/heptaprenylglyceryl phosphate synthase [Hymenobacteraceae bacterium]
MPPHPLPPLPESVILPRLLRDRQRGHRALAVLLDPDNISLDEAAHLVGLSHRYPIDYFFVGGSLVTSAQQGPLLDLLRREAAAPVVLFPSSPTHIDGRADALLLLSLISGRNPELLIGHHVVAAPLLQASGLELLPTGYMLVDTGRPTTASYMSGTQPLPADKPSIAACTALAGEQLGLRVMYLDGGSGAQRPIATALIRAVRAAVRAPLIVGGGLDSTTKLRLTLEAGADVVVVGNHLENTPDFLPEAVAAVREFAPVAV